MRMPHQFAVLMAITTFTTAAEAQPTVKVESLPVYSKPDTSSTILGTLKKGEVVVLEISILGEDHVEWCSIHTPAQKTAGYVRCEALSRPPAPKPAPMPATAPVQSTIPGAGPEAKSPRFWEPGHQETPGEYRYLGYARILATNFDFSQEQKDQTLRIADQIGLVGCIDEDDSYVRKGQTPPGLLRNSRSRTTKCDWIFQTFIEQTFALITPEQQTAHRRAYAEFRQEIANNRRVIEMTPRL